LITSIFIYFSLVLFIIQINLYTFNVHSIQNSYIKLFVSTWFTLNKAFCLWSKFQVLSSLEYLASCIISLTEPLWRFWMENNFQNFFALLSDLIFKTSIKLYIHSFKCIWVKNVYYLNYNNLKNLKINFTFSLIWNVFMKKY
jgi:hypothetical protein